MGEPTKPTIPDDAPQDVKDFFDCKGDKLVWKKGKVGWLGLPVDPDVSFEHGKAKDSIDITITFGKPPLGVSFTLNASVNSDGELTVDSTNLPDLSSVSDKLPGKNDFDNSIKNINAWFKKNGKKLKGATLKKGEVTLEKTTTTGTYAPPPVAPFDDDDLNKPQNVGLTPGWETSPDAGAWDSAVAQTTVGPAPFSTQSDAASPGLSLLTMLLLFGFAAVAAPGSGHRVSVLRWGTGLNEPTYACRGGQSQPGGVGAGLPGGHTGDDDTAYRVGGTKRCAIDRAADGGCGRNAGRCLYPGASRQIGHLCLLP